MENQTFTVNYSTIAEEKSLLAITRLLANRLISNPYMNVGEFFKNLSAADLTALGDIFTVGPDHQNFGDIMLIAEMLAIAEGLENANVNIATERFHIMKTFVICESLFRAGLVNIIRENMSFGEDMKDRIIVEKLNE